MYLLGFDLGSSSVKAALVNTMTEEVVAVAQYPTTEMAIISQQKGWAEQEPSVWWENVCTLSRNILNNNAINPNDVKAIGIAYQMHGLVLVDKNQEVLRPSIIWCDSRAIEIGNRAFEQIGEASCLQTCLNSPGNFTASKLKWVKENEPSIYAQVAKMMLPGDYVAMKMTDEIVTTISGLSEGILWDFKSNQIAQTILDYYGISEKLIPTIVNNFIPQGTLTNNAAQELGLVAGIPITYRAGDQPNNAMTLNVLNAGEIAATGGTSGVVYGVVDKAEYDKVSRVNSFAHVTHTIDNQRIGVLLCINGAGSQYRWIKEQVAKEQISYTDMENQLKEIPIGSDGLRIFPFGNGAERMFGNQDIGAQFINLQFNRHTRAHLYRAALEGIAFSFVYGMQILTEMGLNVSVIRVGDDNLFQSEVFANTIASLMNTKIEVVHTTGAAGAARAAGVGIGIYKSVEAAMKNVKVKLTYEPNENDTEYQAAYEKWHSDLKNILELK